MRNTETLMISHSDRPEPSEFAGGGPFDGYFYDAAATFPVICHIPAELRLVHSGFVHVYYAEQTEEITQYIYMGQEGEKCTTRLGEN